MQKLVLCVDMQLWEASVLYNAGW